MNWTQQMAEYLAAWRVEAFRRYKHKLGTIIILGTNRECVEAPAYFGGAHGNDNRRISVARR
jgi:hypothetical protein